MQEIWKLAPATLDRMRTDRRQILSLLPFPLLAGSMLQDSDPEPKGESTALTVLLVRHAETAESTRSGGDPELSEAGEARAAALARLLQDAGVTHLFCSEFRRTAATLAPLESQFDLQAKVISARDAAAQQQALLDLPTGSVAVVAGHSNTIPALAAALAGLEAPMVIEHEDYDRLFVVAGPRRSPVTLELRYES